MKCVTMITFFYKLQEILEPTHQKNMHINQNWLFTVAITWKPATSNNNFIS